MAVVNLGSESRCGIEGFPKRAEMDASGGKRLDNERDVMRPNALARLDGNPIRGMIQDSAQRRETRQDLACLAAAEDTVDARIDERVDRVQWVGCDVEGTVAHNR